MRQEPPFSLLIFDCDGVLVDSEVIACRIEMEALAAIGHPIDAAGFAAGAVGRGRKDTDAMLEAAWGKPLPEGYSEGVRLRVMAAFESELTPVAGIEAVLDSLRDRRRCVASSSSPPRIATALRVTGLAHFFGDSVFSAVEVPRGKPAPDLFLHAAARIGATPATCIVIEDSVPGIQAAKSAGMYAIGFTAGGHCGPDHGERLRAAGADAITPDAATLARLLGTP